MINLQKGNAKWTSVDIQEPKAFAAKRLNQRNKKISLGNFNFSISSSQTSITPLIGKTPSNTPNMNSQESTPILGRKESQPNKNQENAKNETNNSTKSFSRAGSQPELMKHKIVPLSINKAAMARNGPLGKPVLSKSGAMTPPPLTSTPIPPSTSSITQTGGVITYKPVIGSSRVIPIPTRASGSNSGIGFNIFTKPQVAKISITKEIKENPPLIPPPPKRNSQAIEKSEEKKSKLSFANIENLGSRESTYKRSISAACNSQEYLKDMNRQQSAPYNLSEGDNSLQNSNQKITDSQAIQKRSSANSGDIQIPNMNNLGEGSGTSSGMNSVPSSGQEKEKQATQRLQSEVDHISELMRANVEKVMQRAAELVDLEERTTNLEESVRSHSFC